MNTELPQDLRDEIAKIIGEADGTEDTDDIADIADDVALDANDDLASVEATTDEHSCPTCGRLFKDAKHCEAHAANCEGAGADRPPEGSAAGWPRSRVLQLLKAMRPRYSRFEDMTPKERRAHWRRVGALLGVTGDSARRRWHSLVNGYTRAKSMSMQGRRRAAQQWPYYSEMERIVHQQNKHSDETEFIVCSVMQQPANNERTAGADPELLLRPQDNPDTDGKNSALISFMEDRNREFERNTPDGRERMWKQAADELKITSEEARVRWSILMGTFKRMKVQCDPARHRWKYYSRLERVMSRSRIVAEPTEPLLVLSGQRPLIPPVPSRVFNAVCGPPPARTPAETSTPAGSSKEDNPSPKTRSDNENNQEQQQSIKDRLQEVDLVVEKRRRLCIEDYLRAKLKREKIRLEVEERRVKALERIADVLHAN